MSSLQIKTIISMTTTHSHPNPHSHPHPQPACQQIKKLKQQLHKSFMQIQQMQSLFRMELQHNKQQMAERERLLQEKEQELKGKWTQIQNREKGKQEGFLDVSLEEIGFRKEDTLRDSGVEAISSLLAKQDAELDPEYKMNKLRELQNTIIKSMETKPNSLYELFQFSNELCLQNCRLREQLLNNQQAQEVYRMRIFDSERVIEKLKRSEKSLQIYNDHLNQINSQEVSKGASLEEEMRKVKEELNRSKGEVGDLKKQVEMLTDLLKGASRMDSSKLGVTKQRERDVYEEREKPNFLRMSSNAILIRHQRNTKEMHTTGEIEGKVSSVDAENNMFRKKERTEYGMSRREE